MTTRTKAVALRARATRTNASAITSVTRTEAAQLEPMKSQKKFTISNRIRVATKTSSNENMVVPMRTAFRWCSSHSTRRRTKVARSMAQQHKNRLCRQVPPMCGTMELSSMTDSDSHKVLI